MMKNDEEISEDYQLETELTADERSAVNKLFDERMREQHQRDLNDAKSITGKYRGCNCDSSACGNPLFPGDE